MVIKSKIKTRIKLRSKTKTKTKTKETLVQKTKLISIKTVPLNGNIFKDVASKLFIYPYEKYKSLFSLRKNFNTKYQREFCNSYYYNPEIPYKNKLNLIYEHNLTFNEYKFNAENKSVLIGLHFPHITVNKYIGKYNASKVLIMSDLPTIFYNLDVSILNEIETSKTKETRTYDALVVFEDNYKGYISKQKMENYKKLHLYQNIYGGHEYESYKAAIEYIRDNGDDTSNLYDFIYADFNIVKGFQNGGFGGLLRLPVIFSEIVVALKTLKTHGTLLFGLKLIYPVPFFNKLINILVNQFEKVNFIENTDIILEFGSVDGGLGSNKDLLYLECSNYKNTFTDEMKIHLLNSALHHLHHSSIDVCDLAYFYNNYCMNSKNPIMFYPINKPFIISKTEQPQYPKERRKLNILFDLDFKDEILDVITFDTFLITNKLLIDYVEHFRKMNYIILQHVIPFKNSDDNNNEYIVEESYYNEVFYKTVRDTVKFMEMNKLPYNTNYILMLDKYTNNIISNFYNLENQINLALLKYYEDINSMKRSLQSIENIRGGYEYLEMNEYYDRIKSVYQVKEKLLVELEVKRAPDNVRRAFEDFTRGINIYLARHFNIHPEPSNAFTKIWEIYTLFPFLIPKNTASINIFHICEAPGQMILATKRFISKKRQNIKNHEWYANSLNPYNPQNLETYGNVFDDSYGVIKNNFKRWIWGADNTGDITRPANIRWYRKFIMERMPHCQLIIGDGGLSTFEIEPLILQKLDLSQVIMVLACSSIGGHCVIKHFIPFIKRHEETYGASGFFISFIYLYYLVFEEVSLFKPYTSNPDSSEFYVIGRNFQGISEKVIDKLLECVDRFEFNDALFSKDNIPKTFRIQITEFLNKITKYNSSSIEKQNMLLTCVKDKSDLELQEKFKCNTFLKPENLKKIQEPRYKKWVQMMEFE